MSSNSPIETPRCSLPRTKLKVPFDRVDDPNTPGSAFGKGSLLTKDAVIGRKTGQALLNERLALAVCCRHEVEVAFGPNGWNLTLGAHV